MSIAGIGSLVGSLLAAEGHTLCLVGRTGRTTSPMTSRVLSAEADAHNAITLSRCDIASREDVAATFDCSAPSGACTVIHSGKALCLSYTLSE